jgi:hypothetical protein
MCHWLLIVTEHVCQFFDAVVGQCSDGLLRANLNGDDRTIGQVIVVADDGLEKWVPRSARACFLHLALLIGFRDQVLDLHQRLRHDVIDPFERAFRFLDVILTDQVFELSQFGGQCPGAEDIRETDQFVNHTTGREGVALDDQCWQIGPGGLDLGRKALERPRQQRPAVGLAQMCQVISVEILKGDQRRSTTSVSPASGPRVG